MRILRSPVRREASAAATSLLVIRVTLGAVMLVHGLQKLSNLGAVLDSFATTLGVPAPMTLIVVAAEVLGGLGLIAGVLARPAALGIILVMAGAVALVHAQHGFFMNWFGTKGGEGVEFHLLVLAMAAAVLIGGSGAYSLDRRLFRRR